MGLTGLVGPRTITVEPSEAACAFLTLLIRYAREWVLQRHKFTRGQAHFRYHFGFPAASLNDDDLRCQYASCTAAAIALQSNDGQLSIDSVRAALQDRATLASWEQNAALFPEIAAAVAGFGHSQRREDGLYALIDVGAGTFDCCTFNLFTNKEHALRCPIFSADVSPLGVERWRACGIDQVAATDFRKELNKRARGVIWHTKKCRDPYSQRWHEKLPTFLIGGGAASEPHANCARSLDSWLRHHLKRDMAGVRLIKLSAPENLEASCDKTQLHRLAVAVGLSLSEQDIPVVDLPALIPDVFGPPIREITKYYTGKELT
jgi:hypothetical protein